MSQGATNVPTTGPVSPTTMAGDMNAALNALGSQSSGSSSPINGPSGAPYSFQWWADNSNANAVILKMYDGASWVALATLDTVNHLWKTIIAGVTFFTGVISPTALAADTDDWNPTNLALATRIRVSASSAVKLTGIVSGSVDGRMLILENIGSFNIKLMSNATSTAANRFQFSRDFTLLPGNSIMLLYDATSLRWRSPNLVQPTRPTRQVLTSGSSATYTTPNGCTRIAVRFIGGGGGGGLSATTGGGTGGTTTFNSVTAIGGTGGTAAIAAAPGLGGAGGTGGSGSATIRRTGGRGHDGGGLTSGAGVAITFPGGAGAGSTFNGGGASVIGGASTAGVANTGTGGAGQSLGGVAAGNASGGGGGTGEYVELEINDPAATYTYTIGAGGTATSPASIGGSGVIIVDEHYG